MRFREARQFPLWPDAFGGGISVARKKVIIVGAAGRDFHNFNTFYRDNDQYEVVAFTATQIPDIHGRVYPPSLAGRLYPQGIPIFEESDVADLIKKHDVDDVVFAYSDVPYARVMSMSALVNALGANFILMGSKTTMVESTKPVISVCAVRTGCGKSQTTRYIYDILKRANKRVVAIRHPMPYGDLDAQKVQRFAKVEDLEEHRCTIEEMEEYEPHIVAGNVIYSGVDYEAIVRMAETRDNPDIILFDGGNNDMPFYRADLKVVVVDPLRAGHEVAYYPGEANLRMADVVVINKMDSATPEQVKIVRANIARLAPKAVVIDADSELTLDGEIKAKRVLVIEDGPTLTHGEMQIGAAMVAAKRFGAAEVVEPRHHAVGKIADTYRKYPNIGAGILPAMGYSDQQKRDLQTTINAIDADVILSGTPIDLARIVTVNKPVVRVQYELKPHNGSLGDSRKSDPRAAFEVTHHGDHNPNRRRRGDGPAAQFRLQRADWPRQRVPDPPRRAGGRNRPPGERRVPRHGRSAPRRGSRGHGLGAAARTMPRALPDAVFPNNWFSTEHDGTLLVYPMMAPNRRAEAAWPTWSGCCAGRPAGERCHLRRRHRGRRAVLGRHRLPGDRPRGQDRLRRPLATLPSRAVRELPSVAVVLRGDFVRHASLLGQADLSHQRSHGPRRAMRRRVPPRPSPTPPSATG